MATISIDSNFPSVLFWSILDNGLNRFNLLLWNMEVLVPNSKCDRDSNFLNIAGHIEQAGMSGKAYI